MTARSLAAGAVLISLAVVPAAAGGPSTFPGKPTAFVYQAKGGATYDLYRATVDGKNAGFFVGRPKTDEFNPAWSPSGTRLVFQSGPTDGSNFDVWTVSADGKGAHALIDGRTNDRAPQFCDADTIVFTRQISSTSSDVWALELRTGRLKRLTTTPGIDSFPTCNPKGDRIAFISGREGPPRIYEMAVNGSGQRPLVPAPSLDPDYSPDGKLIAYVAPDPDGFTDVFTMNLASGAVTRMSNTQPPFDFRLPKFAPAVAGRSLAGAAQGAGEIAATRRNRSTGNSTVAELPGGADIVAGEAGAWDYGVYAPACTCRSLKVTLNPSVVFTGLRKRGALKLKLFADVSLRCTQGTGICTGQLWTESVSQGLTVEQGVDVFCSGDCTATDRRLIPINVGGDGRYGFGRRGTGVGALYARVRMSIECNGKTKTKTFQTHFDPDTGKLNYDKSDLNGDGKADGA